MNTKRQMETLSGPTSLRSIAEWTLLLMAAAAGIYSLGAGLGSLYGESGNLLWLVVTAAALIILSKQMGRVHDHWPHRPKHEQAAFECSDALVSAPTDATRETRERNEP